METKRCSKCGVEKALSDFSKNKNNRDGLQTSCKDCRKAYYIANKEKSKQQKKAYYEANKDKIKARYEANKAEISVARKAYYEANKEKKKAYYQANKEKIRAYQKANKDRIKDRRRQYKKERRKNDPHFRIMNNISRQVCRVLKQQGSTKGGSTFSALPYSPQDLVEHLERQFDEIMTWENYGSYWDLDHIYPQSLLPYDSLEHPNFQKCWALENLQPLEHIANIRKSNKTLDD